MPSPIIPLPFPARPDKLSAPAVLSRPQEPSPMRLAHDRSLLVALAISTTPAMTSLVSAHDGPEGHSHGQAGTPSTASAEMARAAKNLWVALTPEQQKKAGF